MKNPLFWVLLPLSAVAFLLLAAVFFTVLAFMPGHITVATFCILGVVLLWALFGRRRPESLAGQRSILGRRQKSSEGLL